MDETLARGLPCGDRDRMGRLFAQLDARLRAVARGIVGDPDAADVVQNAFEKVLLHCAQFRGSARVSTWMHRIVVNEALSWLRRARCREALRIDASEQRLSLAAPDDPEVGASRQEAHERLERALGRLGAADRELLDATALDGRTLAAVSEELGLSLGAVKSRVFRARRRLAQDLAQVSNHARRVIDV